MRLPGRFFGKTDFIALLCGFGAEPLKDHWVWATRDRALFNIEDLVRVFSDRVPPSKAARWSRMGGLSEATVDIPEDEIPSNLPPLLSKDRLKHAVLHRIAPFIAREFPGKEGQVAPPLLSAALRRHGIPAETRRCSLIYATEGWANAVKEYGLDGAVRRMVAGELPADCWCVPRGLFLPGDDDGNVYLVVCLPGEREFVDVTAPLADSPEHGLHVPPIWMPYDEPRLPVVHLELPEMDELFLPVGRYVTPEREAAILNALDEMIEKALDKDPAWSKGNGLTADQIKAILTAMSRVLPR